MEELKERYPVSVTWRAYQLRPSGSPPISPEYRAAIEAKRPQMEAMARERYGLAINSGPFGIDSRRALRGAKYAEAQGLGEAYHDAVFRAYWQQAQSIADTAVLTDIAVQLGMDRDAFLAALAGEQWETAVAADIEQAIHYGLSGVPALVFGGKYLVVGAQPTEALAQVAEKVIAETK